MNFLWIYSQWFSRLSSWDNNNAYKRYLLLPLLISCWFHRLMIWFLFLLSSVIIFQPVAVSSAGAFFCIIIMFLFNIHGPNVKDKQHFIKDARDNTYKIMMRSDRILMTLKVKVWLTNEDRDVKEKWYPREETREWAGGRGSRGSPRPREENSQGVKGQGLEDKWKPEKIW